MYRTHYVSSDIFATPERQDILCEHGVRYWLDMDFNLSFPNQETKEKAVRILEDELEL